MLQILGGRRGGYFLDSGANDGVRASNTLLLEKRYDWTGICVEPNPEFFANLVRNRSCHCVNACIYTHDGEVDFHEVSTLGGIVEDYDPEVRARLERRSGRPLPIVRRAARTIESVLKEAGAPPVIDYWSLDTEGSELALIESFPFHAYSFRVLTVEHNWREPVREAIRRALSARGFARLTSIVIDDCYVNTRLGLTGRSTVSRRRRLARQRHQG